MNLPPPPTGYARATGVVEQRRTCPVCKTSFPATHAGVQCPNKCKSTGSVRIDGNQFPRLAK